MTTTEKLVCPKCGTDQQPGSLACSHCGHVFSDALATRKVSNVEAETRVEWGTRTFPLGGQLILFVGEAKTRLVVNWLGRTSLAIGRSVPKANRVPDVDLAQFGADDAGVSRLHAVLSVQDGQLFIEDAGSANGTWVNGVRLSKGERKTLVDGNELMLARLKIQVLF